MKILLRKLFGSQNNNAVSCYKNADTLPIWNFYKIITTGDVRYLLKNSQDELAEISENDKKELTSVLELIIYSLNKNSQIIFYF